MPPAPITDESSNSSTREPRSFSGPSSIENLLSLLTYSILHVGSELTTGGPMSFPESRRERRMPLNILLNKYIDGEPHVCRAVNVSRGGMLLYKVFEPDLESSEVSVEFQLPGCQRVLRADGVALAEHRW